MEPKFQEILINQQKSIGERYQAVFQLKNIGTKLAIQKLMEAYPHCGDSVLLKHQLLYALGQLPKENYPLVKQFLIGKVEDQSENNLSRHEAAQALANYFEKQIISLYQKHINSDCLELRWTCQIALEKVKNDMKQRYGTKYHDTMEPAAPFSELEFINFLKEYHAQEKFQKQGFLGILCLENIPLFEKYRTMYYMRDLNTQQGRKILCKLLSKQYFKTQTSLLKHEICFIIGQIGCQNYQGLIRECIQNEEQEEIVRHQALAAVASQSKDPNYLQKFVNHQSQLIRQSALVAIHTIKYWNE